MPSISRINQDLPRADTGALLTKNPYSVADFFYVDYEMPPSDYRVTADPLLN